MARPSKNPKYNVISLRVTDDERAHIEEIMRREGTISVPDLLRGVITGWLEVVR